MWKGNWIFCNPTGKMVGEESLKLSLAALQLVRHSFYIERLNLALLLLLLILFYFTGF